MTNADKFKMIAEALGYETTLIYDGKRIDAIGIVKERRHRSFDITGPYNPLTNDAQCMDIVKRMRLTIKPHGNSDKYCVHVDSSVTNGLLNQAVIDCAYKALQAGWKE